MDDTPDADLKRKLSGIVADAGAIVTCRDSSSLEMILRMNNQYTEQFIISMLTHVRREDANTHMPPITAHIFVKDVDRVERDIQSWLNPLDVKSRGLEQTKRGRDCESSESDIDSSDDS